MPNPNDLMKQVTKMRKEVDRVQESLKTRYVEASAGGDLVEVTLNGQQELVKIRIAEKLIGSGADVEMLEDLILAAVNQGLEKSKELMNAEMSSVTGGLASGFPGLF